MKLVIQSDSRIWGGNEKWLLLVGAGLAGRGHDVVVSCKPASPVAERAAAAGLRITHRRPGGDADVPRAIGFALMLRRERPDAVLLSAFKRAFWGGWACRRAGVGRVVERLGIEHDLPPRWKYRKAFRDYIDALIVNSMVIRHRWLDENVTPGRIVTQGRSGKRLFLVISVRGDSVSSMRDDGQGRTQNAYWAMRRLLGLLLCLSLSLGAPVRAQLGAELGPASFVRYRAAWGPHERHWDLDLGVQAEW
mgnify:CR=1 FL=1